jgi:hypothetical protein
LQADADWNGTVPSHLQQSVISNIQKPATRTGAIRYF